MSQTDGEKELVLGNKQLISLFFVVVALCGVFFALGYMIGHNTSKPGSASLDSVPPVSSPAASDVPRSSDSEPPRETAASASTPAPEPQAPPVPAVQTQPVREVPTVPQPGATY